MSTKIYNGYELVGLKSLSEVHQFCLNFKASALKVIRKQICRRQAEVIENILHKFAVTGEDEVELGTRKIKRGEKFYGASYIYVSDRYYESQRSTERSFGYDFNCEFVIIPLPDSDRILALLYTADRELTKLWKKHPNVKEYMYWNNADWPSGMSAKRWNQREEDWEAAIGHDAPCTRGFTFSCMGKYDFPIPEKREAMRFVAPYKKRLARVAKSKLSLKWMKDQELVNSGNTVGLVGKFKEYLATPEGKAALLQEIEECRSVVPESLKNLV